MSQANIYNLTRTTTLISQSTGGGGGIITPIPPLDQILMSGNNSGSSSIVMTDNESIIYQGGIQITNNNSFPATPSNNTGIAIGNSSTLANNPGSIAFGNGTVAVGTNSTAIGNGSSTNHNNSTVIGEGVVSTADDQITIGRNYQTVRVPGNLYAEAWQGGMAHMNGGQNIGIGNSLTLSFDTVDYANDISGFSPVSSPASGHIRLMRLNSMYNISCSMQLNAGVGGVIGVLLIHTTYVSGIAVSARVIGTIQQYIGGNHYVSLAGTVLTDGNVDQYISVIVQNLAIPGVLTVSDYHAAGIRAN